MATTFARREGSTRTAMRWASLMLPLVCFSQALADEPIPAKTELTIASGPTEAAGSAATTGASKKGIAVNLVQLPVTSPYPIAVGDLNNDQITDIATAGNDTSAGHTVIAAYLGTPDGKFQPSQPDNYFPNAFPMAIVDNNGLAVGLNWQSWIWYMPYLNGEFVDYLGFGLTPVPDMRVFAAGDFNNDGETDVAVAHGSSLQVWPMNGAIHPYGDPVPIGIADIQYAANMATGDFNNDGKLDLIVPDNSSKIWILLGKRDGTFEPNPKSIPAGNGYIPQTVAVADFNGDGYLDFAAGLKNTNTGGKSTVVVYQGDGSGTNFTQRASTDNAPTGTNMSVTVGDFNADGDLDLAMAEYIESDPANTALVEIWTGDKSWHFTHTTQYQPGGWPWSIVTGDFNGDKYTDIATADLVGNTVTVAYLEPATMTVDLSITPSRVDLGDAATLTASVTYGNTPVTTGTVYFCLYGAKLCTDINRIGEAQLKAPDGTATLTIRPGLGGLGSYQYVAQFAGTTAEPSATSDPKLLTVTGQYATTTVLGPPSSETGPFDLTASVSGIVPPTAELVPSGNVDIHDTDNQNYKLTSVTLSESAQTGMNLQTSQTLSTGKTPNNAIVADLNQDGRPDLVVANSADKNATVYLGQEGGTFTTAPAATLPVSETPAAVLAADFNNDGRTDVAVANGAQISAFLSNTGSFGFASPVGTPFTDTSYTASHMAVGDFDQNGILDVAVTANKSDETGAMMVLLGKGTGSFAQKGDPVPTGAYTQDIAVGNFGSGNHPSVIVANQHDGTVKAFIGNGDGTFQPPLPVTAGYYPESLAVADFNADGYLDFALGSNGGEGTDSVIQVYQGNGSGAFDKKNTLTLSIPNAETRIATGDFNGDGLTDLGVAFVDVASSSQRLLQIWLGGGTFTFNVGAQVTPGQQPNALASGDFDNDGFSDLATANMEDSTVTVALSQPTVTSTATATGITVVGTGTHALDANYRGDLSFAASDTTTTTLAPAEPVKLQMSMQPADGTAVEADQDLPLTVTLSPATAQNHSADDLLVTITNKTTGEQIGQPQHPSKGIVNLTIQPSQLQQDAKNEIEATTPGNDNFGAASITNTYLVGMENTPQPTGSDK
ncbi:FG-GAP-like repeat-containing protein [Brucella sp. IR073]|uniref:FG-GAP-like repeat-containing protein n=1 Tax=unclassified Brucella TaxID=2632610 RepID=UPI003B983846